MTKEPEMNPAMALDESVLLHARKLMARVVASTLRRLDRGEIDDVVQDSLLSFVRYMQRAGPPSNVDALAVTIAKRHALDFLRRRQRRVAIETKLDAPNAKAVPLPLRIEDEVDAAQLHEVIEAALKQLSPREREVLVSRFAGESTREYAERVGITPNSAAQRYMRAIKKLREQFLESLEELAG